jgi:hypothetical protein
MRDQYTFDKTYIELENAFTDKEVKKFHKLQLKLEKARDVVLAKREEFAKIYGRNR